MKEERRLLRKLEQRPIWSYINKSIDQCVATGQDEAGEMLGIALLLLGVPAILEALLYYACAQGANVFKGLSRLVLDSPPDIPEGPPQTAVILFLFIPRAVREHALADLVEEYWAIIKFRSVKFGRFWFWWQVLATVVAYVLKLARD